MMTTAAEESRSQVSYMIAIIGLIAALIIGIVLLGNILRTPEVIETLIEVPDLSNRAVADAFDALQELDFKVKQRSESSATVPIGFVIGTEPEGGSQLDRETFVTVILSTGPEQFAIPNLLDLTELQARDLIVADDFIVGTVEYRFSEDIEEDIVIDQDPKPGTEATQGAVVNLEISSGPSALTMPDLVNQARQTAERALLRDGFEAPRHRGGVLRRDPRRVRDRDQARSQHARSEERSHHIDCFHGSRSRSPFRIWSGAPSTGPGTWPRSSGSFSSSKTRLLK